MDTSSEPSLIFVYNADGNTISELKYIAKDITGSHDEHSKCGLCALTHGTFSMRKDWQNFISNLPINTKFLHRDEFADAYNMNIDFPAVLQTSDEGLEVLVSAEKINNADSLADLQKIVRDALPEDKTKIRP